MTESDKKKNVFKSMKEIRDYYGLKENPQEEQRIIVIIPRPGV